MGDGDEVIGLSPSFFCASNALGLGASHLLAACSSSALSVPRVSFSPLCLSSAGACGGAWSVVPSCCAVGLAALRSFPVSVVGLLALRSSSRGSVRAADRLPCGGRPG